MKTLLLLLIVASCGYNEPEALDLQDDDGDLIANAYETDMDRYIANIEPLPKLEGKMEVIYSKGTKKVTLSQYGFDHDYITRYLVNDPKLKEIPLFREQGLVLKDAYIWNIEDDEIIDVVLSIPSTTPEFDVITLVENGKITKLGAFKNASRLTLKGADWKKLHKDEAWFGVSRSQEALDIQSRIASQTKRVLVQKGSKKEAYYVSNKISPKDLGNFLNLNAPLQDISADEFMFRSNSDKSWWYREGVNGNAVIAFNKVGDLRPSIMKNLNWLKGATTRIDGVMQSKAIFKYQESVSAKKKLLIKIQSPFHRYRQFSDTADYKTWLCRRGEDDCRCDYTKRWVSAEVDLKIDAQYLMKTLLLRANGLELNMKEVIYYERREYLEGLETWIFAVEVEADEVEFDLQPGKMGHDFIGVYNSNCHKPGNGTSPLSVESSYDLRIAILKLK